MNLEQNDSEEMSDRIIIDKDEFKEFAKCGDIKETRMLTIPDHSIYKYKG